MIASSLGVAGVGIGGLAAAMNPGTARSVFGLGNPLGGAASATEPAVRLAFEGKLEFPVDPTGGGLVVLNNFGGRSTSNGACNHRGVDIGNNVVDGVGRPLLACVDGVVHEDDFLSSAGRLRVLRDATGTFFRYHHLDAYEPTVSVGDEVLAGEVIGFMGRTGNTNWAHLHFEVWLHSLNPSEGTAIDPTPRLPLPIAGVTVNEPTACS